MADTQIAVRDEDVKNAVIQWSGNYFKHLYRGNDFENWQMDAVLAITQNDSLRNCMNTTGTKIELLRALQMNASSGLSLNPQKGEATLVVFNGKKGTTVTHMAMKNGLCKLALKTGSVKKIESGTIYENDIFTPVKSSNGDGYEWKPAIKDRGKPFAYFACITLYDGERILEYQTHEQVLAHALKHGKGRVWDDEKKKYKNEFYPDSSWGKSFDGMAEKTCIRAVLNNLHLPIIEQMLQQEEAEQETELVNVTEPVQHGTSAAELAEDLKNATPASETEPEPEIQTETPPAETSADGEADGETKADGDDTELDIF